MPDPDFPEQLRSLIQETIPTLDAAELLLFLADNAARRYAVPAMVETLRPTALTEPAAHRYLQQFEIRGLVARRENDEFQYAPATPELGAAVASLMRAYNERPVTLVRVIYSPRDEKIRSFADAFRLKK